MKEVDFILKRRYFSPKYTIGRMSLDKFDLCDTLEDTVRDHNADGDLLDEGEGKIPGKTAIPYDRYKVTIVYSPKFKRMVPLLNGVKHFTAIEIHAANTPEQLEGCIAPGENKVKGMVLNSRKWEDTITKIIQAFIAAGYEVYINIVR